MKENLFLFRLKHLRESYLLRKTVLFFIVALAVDGTALAQVKTVTGSVKDDIGEPLIGATIQQVGALTGAITDLNGNFTLPNVPNDATLSISYIGHITQKVNVAGKSVFNITLLKETLDLDEVVVIGYGVQKKSNVTGAISSVKADDLKNLPTTNVASALQGKVSGVQIINNSGAPGAVPTIRIRGYSSNGVSDPLFVVDGLKVANIDYLEPSNIESIEILKDAASAAIYGAEAGNGVILVTTKSGDKGESKIFFDTQLSYSNLAKKVDLMNAGEYANFYKETSDTYSTLFDTYYYNAPSSMINGKLVDTDWQDVIYNTGVSQKYNIGFQGGNNNGSLFVSLGYLQNNGMITGDVDLYKRITGQINASYKIKKWIEIGTNTSFETSKMNQIDEGSVDYGLICKMLMIDPVTPLEYANGLSGASVDVQNAAAAGYNPLINPSTGNYYGVSWVDGAEQNPAAVLTRMQVYSKSFHINGMVFANLTPFKNFVFTTRLGYRFSNKSYNRFDEPVWVAKNSTEVDPLLIVYQRTGQYYQWENFANYNFDWKGNNFSFLAGTSYISNNTNYMEVQTQDLTSSAPNFRYLDYSGNSNVVLSGNLTDQVQMAYYGRIGWSYKGRYNVQVNFRADSYDAAYLDLEHNWGYFPSVSAGWTITNEDFMANIDRKILSFAKLRLSYGKNGSISNLGGYKYASTLNSGAVKFAGVFTIATNNYWMNNQLYTGLYPSSNLANPLLRWEEAKQFGAGLDLRLLNDRLSLTVDYYKKETDGLLVETTAPLTTGTTKYFQNLGIVENSGLEVEAGWKGKIGKDFNYNFRANIATVSNKVTEFQGKGVRMNGGKLTSSSSYISYFEEGFPVWYLYGYKVDRINENTGEAIYKDMDGVEGITDADRCYLGDGIPDFTYGATLSLSYKNVDLMVQGAGAQGSELIYGLVRVGNMMPNRLKSFYIDRWTPNNTGATQASAVYQRDEKYYNSDRYVFDASFFKIKQIQLGYNLPARLLKTIGFSSLRAYISLDNFFTFTSYPGIDPEVRPWVSNSMAIDLGGYPIAKTVSFGLNVSF
ncbi:MAG: SusC/RagA family TonB-linked outer membrane protein [Tannerellaceae bacterium]|jgi:TonB-linked SusC/RagA family outer membrane protein|nr:SusC/RagA family TonB-linked outer membrane protein [Tannerellaceae bacterium]